MILKGNNKEAFWLIFTGISLILGLKMIRSEYWSIDPHAGSVTRKELVLPVLEIPSTLDPQQALSANDKALGLLYFSRLIATGESLQIEPDLVESWSFDFVRNTYHFKIKNKTFFHDGGEITSDDIIFSIHEWAKINSLDSESLLGIVGVNAYRTGMSDHITGLRKVSKKEFDIEMAVKNEDFILTLSLPRFVIYPNKFRGKSKIDFLKNPIGSGPFRLIKSNPGEIKSLAYDNYHLGKPRLESITITKVALPLAINKFNKSLVNNLAFYDVFDLSQIDRTYIDVIPTKKTSLIAAIIAPINNILLKKEIRYQIANILQNNLHLEQCYAGSALSAKRLIPVGFIGSNLSENRKRSLPDLSNLKNVRIEVNYTGDLQGDCFTKEIANFSLRKNINFVGKAESLEKMFAMLKQHKLPIWIEELVYKNADPISILQYFDENSNEYFLQKSGLGLRKYFEPLNSNISLFERADLYRKIDEFLINNSYVVPLFFRTNFLVKSKKLKGIDFLVESKFINRWHQIYVE